MLTLLGAVAVAAGMLLGRALNSHEVDLEGGSWLPKARAVASFQVSATSGQPFTLSDLRGHPSLLFFGYTNCPDACPTTLATLAQVQRDTPLPHSQVIFVSIDPARDSIANLQVYLAAFDKSFIGLRGEPAALAPLVDSLGVIAVREALPGGSYTMDHSTSLYVLDSSAALRAILSPPFTSARLSADLQRLAASGQL